MILPYHAKQNREHNGRIRQIINKVYAIYHILKPIDKLNSLNSITTMELIHILQNLDREPNISDTILGQVEKIISENIDSKRNVGANRHYYHLSIMSRAP
jgi:hypothetical protein